MRTKNELYQEAMRTVAARRQMARARAEDARAEAEAAVPALRHAEKRGKEHDDENIVAGRARHDELRDALVHSAALLHQLHHARHDHRGRHRREHRAHDRRLHARDAEKMRREQHIAEDLTACGQAGHQHRWPAHAL